MQKGKAIVHLWPNLSQQLLLTDRQGFKLACIYSKQYSTFSIWGMGRRQPDFHVLSCFIFDFSSGTI